ncbi:hypothetical protein QOT17_008475 [Balamuthia mandrillaris]
MARVQPPPGCPMHHNRMAAAAAGGGGGGDIQRCPMQAFSLGGASAAIKDTRSPNPSRSLLVVGNVFVGSAPSSPQRQQGTVTSSNGGGGGGGGALYSSVAAAHLGMKVEVLTKCRQEDVATVAKLFDGAAVHVSYVTSSSATTCVKMSNPSEQRKIQRLESVAAPFTESELQQHLSSTSSAEDLIIHIAPVCYGELPEHLIPLLRSKARYLVVDVTGFLLHHHKAEAERVENSCLKDWVKKEEYLPMIDLLKVEGEEACRVLTGKKDLREAVKILVERFGAKNVLATSKDAILLYDHDTKQFLESSLTLNHQQSSGEEAPASMHEGSGDTALAAFLAGGGANATFSSWKRRVALEFAAKVTAVKLQYAGPYRRPSAAL